MSRRKDYCFPMQNLLGKGLKGLKGPILVTGHTGFKGTWLTLLLECLDIPVVGLSQQPLENSLFNKLSRRGLLNEEFGDIRDRKLVETVFEKFKPSAVIHMAAQPLVSEGYRSPILTFETNVIGTANILDIGVRSDGVSGIVSVTTDKVYRNNESGIKFKEQDPLEGKDPYSASKVGSEASIAAWQQISKINGGPPICSARAGNVIGGGDYTEGRLMKDISNSLINDMALEVRNFKSNRPWQHVLDPLRGYIGLLEHTLRTGESIAMNFGPREASLSVEQVVIKSREFWSDITDTKDQTFLETKQSLVQFAESENLDLDSSLAASLLGWNPKWDQYESIERTLKWWHSVECKKMDVEALCVSEVEEALS
jgi:CDP-glucose 4,6-dehydratase